MLHGASNPEPHLAGLDGGQGIRDRCLGRGDAVLIRGKAAPVAPLIPDRGEADSLAQPLCPPEDRLRFTTLPPLLEEPDTADLHKFVGARAIPRVARDDRPDEGIEAPQHVLCRFAFSRLVVVAVIVAHEPLLSGRVRIASVTAHRRWRTAPQDGQGILATTSCREVHDPAGENARQPGRTALRFGEEVPSGRHENCRKLPRLSHFGHRHTGKTVDRRRPAGETIPYPHRVWSG